jgi:hypothetical protein
MILVKRRQRGIPYIQKWFARHPSPRDIFSIVIYYQYLGNRSPSLFLRRPFAAAQIDIGREPEAIRTDMQKNVRYKIRRADKDGLQWEVGVSPQDFASFHETFAHKKGIEGVDVARIMSFGSAIVLSRVVLDGKVLSQHAHLVDEREGRARMLYSSSARFDGADASLVGRANCWCHWKEMVYFRDHGIQTYDLGGIALNTKDPTLVGINEFKLGFGGKVVPEDHWLSPLYFLASLAGAS